MSWRRRAGIIAGAVVIAALAGCAACFFLVLRRCGDVRDVRRGSFDYRLCGVGSELIARVPIVAPASEPLYSWTLADGTKPGRNVLRYESVAPPNAVRTTLAEFLRQTGFSEKSADSDDEWWTDHHTELGLSIRGASGGSHGEILHNTGSD